MIFGDRIILRAVERTDIRQLWEWMQDQELMRLRYHPMFPDSVANAERAYEESIGEKDEDVRLAICTTEGDLIGETSLRNIDYRLGNAEFSIAIGSRAHLGRGYGTDATRTMMHFAFEQLNLHRVTLHVHDFNDHAIHTYLKCGFKEEGRLREAEYMDGRRSDIVVMGLLRREFEALGL